MKKFCIEHIGISVRSPIAMADWYKEVLGFNIKIALEDTEKAAAFITDSPGNVMLELGRLPNITALCEKTDHHLQLHIGIHSQDPDSDAQYLIAKGATFIEKCPVTKPGENIQVLYDPWGNCLQLVKRG
jgi:hypothetical protein